jgi:hypothetical protein
MTAHGGNGLLATLEGTDLDSEIDSSSRLGSREGALRSIQSTKCNNRATWAAASFSLFYLTSDEVNREGEAFAWTSDRTLEVSHSEGR